MLWTDEWHIVNSQPIMPSASLLSIYKHASEGYNFDVEAATFLDGRELGKATLVTN